MTNLKKLLKLDYVPCPVCESNLTNLDNIDEDRIVSAREGIIAVGTNCSTCSEDVEVAFIVTRI